MTCSKKRYLTYASAYQAGKRTRMRAYFCPRCKGFHLSSCTEAQYFAKVKSFYIPTIKLSDYQISLFDCLELLDSQQGVITARRIRRILGKEQEDRALQLLRNL